ncbi:DEAD-box ATP-dependent RNA helicase 22, partial [Tanacetum coccineum]
MAATVGWAYSSISNVSSHATNDMYANVHALVRLLQSFLQQAPNELTREGKLSNVLVIFNKLVSSRSKNSPSEKLLDMESVLENNEDMETDSIVEDDEESELKRLWVEVTEAKWVSGLYLHRLNLILEQKWVEVTVDTQVNVLMDVVNLTKLLSSNNG